MGATERVIGYVDGFNLYFGVRAQGRRFLWLDVEDLARRLIKPHQTLTAVRYFTAPIRDDPSGQQRQQTYLKAVAAHCKLVSIHSGRFQTKKKFCRSCHATWLDYEEKESDVALVVALVEDCACDRVDTALVISADADMCPAVRAAKRLSPAARIVAALPPNRRSSILEQSCDATLPIGMDKIRQAQLPEVIQVGTRSTTGPTHWK